jgi:hypothetical protein
MPYNNYYPFMQGYQMPYMQNYQQQAQQIQQPIQQPAQIQDGGVVCVKDETAARNYPIAPGVSMTLIDEPRQHLFIKTMGFNQLEKPVFKKFQLIPENENNGDLSGVSPETVKDTSEDLKPQIEGLQREIEGIKAEIEKLKAEKPKKKIAAKLAREENEDET